MIVFDDNEQFIKIMYGTKQIVTFDSIRKKAIWYNKVDDGTNENRYFINQMDCFKDNPENTHIQLHFRGRGFSESNVCMISIEEEKNSSFYIAKIDDTMFYRTLEFGDLNIAVKDFELEIKTLLHNIQKANKNFEPI